MRFRIENPNMASPETARVRPLRLQNFSHESDANWDVGGRIQDPLGRLARISMFSQFCFYGLLEAYLHGDYGMFWALLANLRIISGENVPLLFASCTSGGIHWQNPGTYWVMLRLFSLILWRETSAHSSRSHERPLVQGEGIINNRRGTWHVFEI